MRLAGRSLVLDTNILVHLLRGGGPGMTLDREYELRTRRPRPIVPVVVKGEIKAFARRQDWQAAKLTALSGMLSQLVQALRRCPGGQIPISRRR